MYVTVAARKAREIERLRSASESALEELRVHAAACGGRYLVFGSAARGDLVPASDFDVLVDFPEASERQARHHAEAVCRRLGLVPDVHLAAEASDRLMARVRRDAIVLS